MHKEMKVTIENKLITEQRDINVYHNATRSAHIISYNSSVTLPLKPVLEEDYLHISIVSGPGSLEQKSLVNLPALVDFELSIEGNITVMRTDNRTTIKIPAGPPKWELRVTRSAGALTEDQQAVRLTIADERQEHI
jgi:hypothetical protein